MGDEVSTGDAEPTIELTREQLLGALVLMKREIIDLYEKMDQMMQVFSQKIIVHETVLEAYVTQYPLKGVTAEAAEAPAEYPLPGVYL